MKARRPARVHFEGFRYEIRPDGRIFGQEGARRNAPCAGAFTDEVVDAGTAEEIRRAAKEGGAR